MQEGLCGEIWSGCIVPELLLLLGDRYTSVHLPSASGVKPACFYPNMQLAKISDKCPLGNSLSQAMQQGTAAARVIFLCNVFDASVKPITYPTLTVGKSV